MVLKILKNINLAFSCNYEIIYILYMKVRKHQRAEKITQIEYKYVGFLDIHIHTYLCVYIHISV